MRALLHSDLPLRNRKIREVVGLANRFQFLALLETHGTTFGFDQALKDLRRSHFWFHSSFVDCGGICRSDAGGMAMVIPKDLVHAYDPVATSIKEFVQEIVGGRILRIKLAGCGRKPINWFVVHNFGLEKKHIDLLESSIKRCVDRNELVVLNGDFNLYAKGEQKISVADPVAGGLHAFGDDQAHAIRPFQRRWQRIFDLLTEVTSTVPTRYNSSDFTLTRIDRTFSSAPRSSLPEMRHEVGAVGDPIDWHARGISDHTPNFWKVSNKPRGNQKSQRLKKEWCSHPLFKVRLEALVAEAELDKFPLHERNELFKEFMRDAALAVRDKLFLDSPNSINNSLIRLGSIARAVWQADPNLATRLLKVSDIAKDHLRIGDGGLPELINPPLFEEALRKTKESSFANLRREIVSEPGG